MEPGRTIILTGSSAQLYRVFVKYIVQYCGIGTYEATSCIVSVGLQTLAVVMEEDGETGLCRLMTRLYWIDQKDDHNNARPYILDSGSLTLTQQEQIQLDRFFPIVVSRLKCDESTVITLVIVAGLTGISDAMRLSLYRFGSGTHGLLNLATHLVTKERFRLLEGSSLHIVTDETSPVTPDPQFVYRLSS